MKYKRITAALLALCVLMTLHGAGWFQKATVVVDTENNPVYKHYSTVEISAAFASNEKTAEDKFQGEPVLLSGTVESVEKNGKNIVLAGTAARNITCLCEKSLRNMALQYKAGDRVAVYGHIIVNIFTKTVYLNVDKIVAVPASATSTEMYYLLDGTPFDKRNAVKETLNGGGVEYYVPAAWTNEKIRHSVKDKALGTMEGYQYVLNKLTADSTPESLFVCYFDNMAQLAYPSDAKETELIEKAIVENILGNVGSFPSEEVKTYYGSDYDYYSGVFKNALETGDGYRTEFIFQADGQEGIVVVLYVYREPKHVSDLLFMMRFLEIL